MPYRSPARFLAPLALVAAFLSVYLVVKPSSEEQSDEPATTTSTTRTTSGSGSGGTTRKSYTVKSGDVLSAIAESTGVPLERIIELNPDLDPQALRAGQKIKLRR
ncbi:LysM peptidoglycan-binding domain-containing protein [Conexibacter sp. W3-3-2]|uniref:LysM domain-containing protein n=1 Tax=Paraconexibacter algicola TaxID=2133960 RepID=A0A2T4UF14_9ACTN|nr:MULTISPECIES: LysM domain-containing protein [Solirubrobacterales]MTD47059.1 LysM peptidoglycan-binding domain-containing protein [Conexibacter sp. W3-3-2]PTL56374.1 hypothetical protein C7Y72_15520 [Paraconexibacter algicola]